ncbi:sialate O-acetylesterase [Alteromonas sp. KUL49]|uniref:sialate O-acetylesterase n=1 Tax=Alteromonas sp. KUL49 TaxID=2480798 RepID=UPI0010FFBFB6|nr:sialate O-acetylesterase [Alteromonas sp. KUL49]GEA10180.1 9-O-acetylesterase [Alteromonas sp. KUL49]
MKGFLGYWIWAMKAIILMGMMSTATAETQLTTAAIFYDHMVMQRDKPVKIWGSGTPSSVITATLTLSKESSVTSSVVVNTDGEWLLELPQQRAGGPYELTITSGSEIQHFRDVMIGDVWLASGQSNMEWKLHQQVDNWQDEVRDSDYPDIRFFEIDNHFSATPQSQIKSSYRWVKANPRNSGNFSAVAWFFAKSLHVEKGIPIAIIDSTWGGTPAEAWTSLPVLSQQEHYRDMAASIMKAPDEWEARFAANEALITEKYALVSSSSGYADGAVLTTDYDDSQWEVREVPNPSNAPFTDVAWLRKTVNLAEVPDTASLHLGRLEKLARVFVNGQQVYEQYWTDFEDSIDIPHGLLKQGDNIIAVRLINDWDNKAHLGMPNKVYLMIDKQVLSLEGHWKYSNQVELLIPKAQRYNESTGVLFNAMVHPIVNYPLKGVIWYQGESNVGANEWYSTLFKSMILDWRQRWDQLDLPFLFVQLASFLPPSEVPEESAWAQLRDAQTSVLTLPKTGMAVALDVGDADDIHPRNKQAIGHRLYLAAKHVAYGESLLFSGPQISDAVPDTHEGIRGVMVSFQHNEGLQAKHHNRLLGFAIAGADRTYVNAKARILDDAVFVYSEQINEPVSVRYGWANNSNGNLYNRAELPAVPFEINLE